MLVTTRVGPEYGDGISVKYVRARDKVGDLTSWQIFALPGDEIGRGTPTLCARSCESKKFY